MNGTRTPTAGERVAVPMPSMPVRAQRPMIVNVMRGVLSCALVRRLGG
jgi:hypothetical protein